MKHLRRFNEDSNGDSGNKKWALYAGLGGGFGGANFIEFFNGSEGDAEMEAYRLACQEYDSYAGASGLRTTTDIMEEDGIEDESEAEEIYNGERESWLAYHAELFDENKDYN